MKKFLIPVLILMGLISLTVTACGIGYIVGSGPVVDQTYDFTSFKNIEISNAFNFEITHSEGYGLTISAHQNLFSHLDIKMEGSTLIVRMKPGSYTNSEIKAAVSLPELSSLSVSGASRGSARGFTSGNTLNITLSGSSQLDLDVEAGKTIVDISGASRLTGALVTGNVNLKISGSSKLSGSLTAQDVGFSISGASQCEISGSAGSGDIGISGASRLTAPSFKMQDCAVNVSGASNARIFATGTLDIEASGASTVKYSGGARIKGLDVTGASHVSSE